MADHRMRRRVGGAIALALAVVLSGQVALAQKKGALPPKKAAAASIDAKALVAKLGAPDAGTIGEALAEATKAGPAAAELAPAIAELLRRGAPKDTTKAALDALGAIGLSSSSPVVRTYLRHREAELRKAAVRALISTKGPEAVLGFKEGLRSGDAVVRGFSATGLGNLGAKDALADLFLALDRSVTEAAASVGQLCGAEECERFAGKLGALPFDVMVSGFDPILFRASPLGDEALLKIVGRIRELGTPEAGKYLADVQSRWPAGGSAKVKQALDLAATSIPGARGAGGG